LSIATKKAFFYPQIRSKSENFFSLFHFSQRERGATFFPPQNSVNRAFFFQRRKTHALFSLKFFFPFLAMANWPHVGRARLFMNSEVPPLFSFLPVLPRFDYSSPEGSMRELP